MDTDDVLVFTTAAVAGSLAETGRRLGLAPMATTRKLAKLEKALGVRLFQRTTRSLSLTPEGETFLPFARALVENEAEGVARLRSAEKGASGLLRVSVPASFGMKFVTPLVPDLLKENPELRVALELSDSLPDLVASGIDLAVRIARLRDSSLIAKRLANNPRVLVASPTYLENRGSPQGHQDLAHHECIRFQRTTHWTFIDEAQERHVRVNGRFTSNSIEGCHAMALGSVGITLLSWWKVADDIREGRLKRISLNDGEPEAIGIWAVYPTTRLVLPKVRVFISALEDVLKGLPEFID